MSVRFISIRRHQFIFKQTELYSHIIYINSTTSTRLFVITTTCQLTVLMSFSIILSITGPQLIRLHPPQSVQPVFRQSIDPQTTMTVSHVYRGFIRHTILLELTSSTVQVLLITVCVPLTDCTAVHSALQTETNSWL